MKHRICSECHNYLGKWDEVQIEQCTRCKSEIVNSFFVEFDIESKLQNAFEIMDLSTLIDLFEAECATRNPQKI